MKSSKKFNLLVYTACDKYLKNMRFSNSNLNVKFSKKHKRKMQDLFNSCQK